MNILFLAHRVPYPPSKGDKLRAFNIIKYLSAKHNVHLFCISHENGDDKYKTELLKWCKTVDIICVNLFLKKLLTPWYIFKKLPLTLPFFYSEKLMKLVLEKHRQMDMSFIFSSSMAQYVIGLKMPKIMDFIDADSDKWRQYADFAKFPVSMIYRRESFLLAKHEEEIIKNVNASIVVSNSEEELFKLRQPDAKVFTVSNGVDFEHFKPAVNLAKENIAVFTGEMNYFANVDAVRYFYEQIFMLVKQSVPDFKFYIVGRNPAKEVRELAEDKDIIVTGEIPDVREFIARAKVCVVPMRIGRGIQNKVLEAMSMGKSVVATPLAVRGINVVNNEEIFVAGNAREFAEKIVELLYDEKKRENMGRNARKAIEERYSWGYNLKRLDELIEGLNPLPSGRG